MRSWLYRRALWAAFGSLLALLLSGAAGASSAQAPVGAGSPIIRLSDGEQVPFPGLIRDLAQADIVLVGEEHDSRAHHRAQQQVIAALLGRGEVAVGMESFPSTRQAALDRWWQGRLSRFQALLREVGWFEVWGITPSLYRPILETVRMQGAPLVGINVPRDWIGRVARKGLESLDEEQRRRIGPIAPPAEEYRRALRESLSSHGEGKDPERFIEAQTAWDAAMAGGLLGAVREHPDAVVVGVVGKGHIQGGYGVPHQLHARAEDLEVRTVLPYDPGEEERPGTGEADYAWALDPDRAGKAVRIGAVLDTEAEGPGIAIKSTKEGYPGAEAGLRAGDRILAVNGRETPDATLLIYRIRQQQWGGCLRLRIRRDGDERTLTVPLEHPEEGSPAHPQ